MTCKPAQSPSVTRIGIDGKKSLALLLPYRCYDCAVPIYRYEPIEGGCKVCGGCFELLRPADRPTLDHCPVCRKKVRQVFDAFHTPSITKPLSVSDAKQAGFTLFKKVEPGVYEKE